MQSGTIFDDANCCRQEVQGSSSLGESQGAEGSIQSLPLPSYFFRAGITAVTPSAGHVWAGLFIATKNSLVYFHKAGSRLINGWSTALETFTQYW